MPPKVRAAAAETSLGPQVGEGELVFGVAHIFASFNDTFVHVTDLSGKETITRVTGEFNKQAETAWDGLREVQPAGRRNRRKEEENLQIEIRVPEKQGSVKMISSMEFR